MKASKCRIRTFYYGKSSGEREGLGFCKNGKNLLGNEELYRGIDFTDKLIENIYNLIKNSNLTSL